MSPVRSEERDRRSLPSRAPARDNTRPERVCPTCGSELLERKCKLFCPEPGCGYYMSCSDFY
jgi:hypothetical protein